MKASEFPAFVLSLPEADLPFDGLRGWLLQSESGQVLFNESNIELTVPEHSHGNQWGVVIDGKIDLTVGDQTQTYSRGDTYFIPAGTPHQARIHPGYRAIDYFADRNRYSTRSHSPSLRMRGKRRQELPVKSRVRSLRQPKDIATREGRNSLKNSG